MVLAVSLAFTGCATSGGGEGAAKGKSDNEAIAESLNTWKAGMETKDLAKLSAAMSDKFNHYEWGNKESMLNFLKEQFETGTLDSSQDRNLLATCIAQFSSLANLAVQLNERPRG